MPTKVKNNLVQLAKAERYIARFQLLSNIHERTLNEHRDQLDFTWKNGYEAGVRDTNLSNQNIETESKNIQQLRLLLSTRESELDQLTLEHVDLKQKLLDQAKRHRQRVDELKTEIAQKPISVQGTLVSINHDSFVVRNWRDSKKWISNWCFGLIAFFAVTPIPPELLVVLPENVRYYLIAFAALCGFAGRYINQTKPVHLPPINGDADV